MAPTLTHPERVAMARLHALLELLPTALDQRLSEAGITTFEHTLLSVLAESKHRRLRLSELASKTNATLPRLSRVATSLVRRGLIARTPCAEDGRATNAVLTDEGALVLQRARVLYDSAVRELIFSGLQRLPGNGVDQLTDLTYAMLTSLDTDRAAAALVSTSAKSERFGANESEGEVAAAGEITVEVAAEVATEACAADPHVVVSDCAADPDAVVADCAADPNPAITDCAADPSSADAECAANPSGADADCAADPRIEAAETSTNSVDAECAADPLQPQKVEPEPAALAE